MFKIIEEVKKEKKTLVPRDDKKKLINLTKGKPRRYVSAGWVFLWLDIKLGGYWDGEATLILKE